MREVLEQIVTHADGVDPEARAAIDGGAITMSDIQSRIDVEDFRERFMLDDPELNRAFDAVVRGLVRKIVQELYGGYEPGG